MKAALAGLVVLAAGWAIGGVLIGLTDHVLLGLIIGLAAIPVALGVSVTLGDRV